MTQLLDASDVMMVLDYYENDYESIVSELNAMIAYRLENKVEEDS